jgi:hypothetical protein
VFALWSAASDCRATARQTPHDCAFALMRSSCPVLSPAIGSEPGPALSLAVRLMKQMQHRLHNCKLITPKQRLHEAARCWLSAHVHSMGTVLSYRRDRDAGRSHTVYVNPVLYCTYGSSVVTTEAAPTLCITSIYCTYGACFFSVSLPSYLHIYSSQLSTFTHFTLKDHLPN